MAIGNIGKGQFVWKDPLRPTTCAGNMLPVGEVVYW
jgi:hypothetical protein